MKDIEGYEGLYAVTPDGQIWNYRSNAFQALRGSGHVNKRLRRKRNYRTVALWKKGKGYRYAYVHRLVAAAFLPNENGLPIVNHKDGNPENNDAANLEWCTHAQNVQHAVEHGLLTRGSRNTQTKLRPKDVVRIRKIYAQGRISQRKLGEAYGVTQSNIFMIVKRKNWT